MRFDEMATSYDEHADAQRLSADWCAEWIPEECGHLDALEFGSGTGLFTTHLADAGFRRFTATDLSPEMVAEGKRRVWQADWKVEDAWLPSQNGLVDCIFATSLLQWAVEPEVILKRWRELLRDEGRVLASIYLLGTLGEMFSIDESISAVKWRDTLEWLDLFDRAGFEVPRWDVRADTFEHRCALHAFRWLHGTGAVSKRGASISRLRRMLSALDRRYLSCGSCVPTTWRTLRIEAVVAR